MYGLVNKAIEDYVIHKFGEETWENIKRKANIDIDVFISNEGYPDCLTYGLVQAASETLGIDPAAILQAFGEYWVLYTGREGYGELFEGTGATFKEFLINLPNLHSRVTLLYPHLQPPQFQCTDVSDNALTLHYRSERKGLAPMVVGVLKGLGALYHTDVQIDQTQDRVSGADHDQFHILFQVR